ncbi:MAG: NDP-sugar synthase [Acidobacteriota bacterium]
MTEFFLLAGGYGKRAEPLSSYLPKPIFPLNGIPLISHISSQLKKGGVSRGNVNLCHMGEKIENIPLPGLDIEYINEKVLSGNRVLKEAAEMDGEYLLVVNGDTYMEVPVRELIKKVDSSGADGAVLLRAKGDGVYSSVIFNGENFLKRDKDPVAGQFMYTGVSVFRKEIVNEFREENLFDSLERIGANIKVLIYDGIWFDLGTPELYFSADSGFRKYYGIKNTNSLSSNVSILPESDITNSIIWENTQVGNRVKLNNCIVTGNMSLENCNYSNKIITPSRIYDLKI